MPASGRASRMRHGEGAGRVTTVELFFDLVYVFAITQLSHSLLDHLTGDGVFRTAILLAVVWQIWIYTTWGTTYVDPRALSVRAMLLVLMLGSLVMSAELPEAFGRRGMVVALVYALMQVGRAVWLVVVMRGEAIQATFRRVILWSAVSGALMIGGAALDGHGREALWVIAIAVDVLGAAIGFPVPGMGASDTRDWTIMGGHFAERVQAFVLIALGESIVVIGGTLGDLEHPSTSEIVAVLAAFVGAVGFWWVYYDRAADESAELIDAVDDPGRLARSAFHWVHPILIAGIVVSAAADERVLHHPTGHGSQATATLTLVGTALFLLGHAIFKALVWRVVSWQRVGAGIVVLALLPLGAHTSSLTIGFCALAALVVVAIADRLLVPAAAG